MTNYRPFLIIAGVLILAAAGTALLLRSNDSVGRNAAQESGADENQNNPDRVVTLEEFGDYQCPACGQLHPTLKRLKQEYGDRLNFVFRNLPLTKMHKNAMIAAQAAEAARVQNHFWEMHDKLYENQDLWKEDVNARSIFLKFASELGLNTEQFKRDMDGQQIQLRIQTDMEAAAEQGIDGTPTILINGRQLRAEMTTPEGVKQGIEVMLKGHQNGAPAPTTKP